MDLVSPLAKRLAARFRVITYQLRGEGDCFALRRRFGMKDLVNDLAEFLSVMGLERPNLLGVSFGGVIGLEYAARYPHQIQTLCLQGVGARFESNLVERVTSLVLSGYPLPSDSPFINQFLNLLFGRGKQSREMIDATARHCWQTDQSVMTQRFRMVRRRDLSSRLQKVRTPVLVISGNRDIFVSPRSLCDLCSGLPHSQCVRLPTGGHLAFLTDAERMAREVERFVAANS
jgi:pimeloyl-ACP methyl ester carboxylesterase